jgi:hypothetical protein
MDLMFSLHPQKGAILIMILKVKKKVFYILECCFFFVFITLFIQKYSYKCILVVVMFKHSKGTKYKMLSKRFNVQIYSYKGDQIISNYICLNSNNNELYGFNLVWVIFHNLKKKCIFIRLYIICAQNLLKDKNWARFCSNVINCSKHQN